MIACVSKLISNLLSIDTYNLVFDLAKEKVQDYYKTQILTRNINHFGLRMIMIILLNRLMFSSEIFARKKEVWALELSMIGIISNKKRLNCDLANVQRKHNMSAICMRQSSFAILVIEKLK